MTLFARRTMLVGAGALAGATLASALWPRKPSAAALGVLDPISPPVPLPDAPFTTEDGSARKLSDFAGRGMVVNLWATWCVPCVEEMPSLARLAAALGPHDIAVMPLSSDRGGAAVVRSFFERHDIHGLPVLLDPGGATARAFNVRGVPTTIIVNKQGLESARVEGAVDWGRPEIADAVRKLVG